MEWEQVAKATYRMRVPQGWLYQVEGNGGLGPPFARPVASALCFVPDPEAWRCSSRQMRNDGATRLCAMPYGHDGDHRHAGDSWPRSSGNNPTAFGPDAT